MTEPVRTFESSRLRRHLLFAALGIASVALFLRPLRELSALALSADAYSYILLIPAISAFAVFLDHGRIFASAEAGRETRPLAPRAAALIAFALLASLLATGILKPTAEYALPMEILSLLPVWAAVFALCYGLAALRSARFPFLLLLLMVPMPSHAMDKVVTNLQWGSAEATYLLFQLVGVPVFRTGVSFELPIIGIQVAKECSSIHSACALFITSLLVGHLFLKSLRAKVCLTVLSVPIAMLTNAVRITTLWTLATKVDMGFLYGDLHHRGGIVFSVVSLSVLMSCLWGLRKVEGRGGGSLGA
jgi:exosortase